MRSPARLVASLAVTVAVSRPLGLRPDRRFRRPGYPHAPATVPGAKAKLTKSGAAIAPAGAPIQVQMAINAGNQIRKMPYEYGGGHQSFFDSGYDCSGAVSYVLNGTGLIDDPIHSTPRLDWGSAGRGVWITVYANASHAYMVIAGLRFDTSAVGEKLNSGSGPRWRATKRPAKGYTAKYYPSL